MKWFGRTFTLTVFLTLCMTVIYTLAYRDSLTSWKRLGLYAIEELIEEELFDLPLLVVFALGALFISAIIVTAFTSNKLEREMTEALRQVKDGERPHISHRSLQHEVDGLFVLLEDQRKSLQKATNERAEADEKMIEEQLIQERQRLARELHDSVSQQLFAASMLLSAMVETNEEDEMLRQVENIVQQAQLEMRALLLHLRPAALHNHTFKEGMEQLLMELKQKVMFDITYELEDVHLQKGEEDHLFRIAQETLSNTLRHSKATEVHILFVERDHLAILRIQDNGVGFEQQSERSGSYGLQNVKERAIEIGAQYKIVSVPSQGTIVEVKLPLEQGGERVDDTHIISRRS